MFLKAVDDGGVHVVECLHVFSRDGSERSLFVTIQLFHNAGHENVARRQTKNPRPPPVRLAAFPADESRSPRQPEQCAALRRIIQGARVGVLRAACDQPDFHGIVPPLLSDGYGRILRQRLSHRILQRHLGCIPKRCLGLRGGLLRPGQ